MNIYSRVEGIFEISRGFDISSIKPWMFVFDPCVFVQFSNVHAFTQRIYVSRFESVKS
jgi:hypothetical protein